MSKIKVIDKTEFANIGFFVPYCFAPGIPDGTNPEVSKGWNGFLWDRSLARHEKSAVVLH